MIRKLLFASLLLLPAVASDGAVPISATLLAAGLPHCGDDTLPPGPQIMPGYGGGGFAIETDKPDAQAFFSNGMQLAHAFAHKAASAAMAEAARLDPACAMCQWGIAWAAGPTINYGVGAAEQAVALRAARKAAALLPATASEKHRAMVAALELRYVNGGGAGAGDRAFAAAMGTLADRYPDDDEIAVIAADALMIPFTNASHPGAPHLERSETLLARVLARRPDYTPAIHFYVHVTEIMGHPARAERFADQLARLAPESSHLTHMPSHTYYWIGRYQDAVDANVKAVAMGVANAKRAGLAQPGGEWQLPYHAHNVHYGVAAALLSGDGASALALSEPALAAFGGPKLPGAASQVGIASAYFAEGRYADPAHVLALPEPDANLPYARAFWHYARGEAEARVGNVGAVRAEVAAIPAALRQGVGANMNPQASQLVMIGRGVLAARAAMLDHDYAGAARAFDHAARLEEARVLAPLNDPPAWWYPVRRSEAAALLAKGDARRALKQIDAALNRRPGDPVSLLVRAEAETALGETAHAQADRTAAARAWHGSRDELRAVLATA